jgi:phage gp45-like
MSTVPFIFAGDTGNIPLSQLDVNFANVKAFANTAGYVTANAQPNITSVGTLTSLSVSGNVTGNYFIGNGSQLTGIVSNYSNANVATFLANFGSNLITTTGTITATTLTGQSLVVNFISSDDSAIVQIQDGLEVDGNVIANGFSNSNGTFRLPSLTSAEIANIVAANGDMVYNSTASKIQGYENGSWGNVI